jgi:hypothetical protein
MAPSAFADSVPTSKVTYQRLTSFGSGKIKTGPLAPNVAATIEVPGTDDVDLKAALAGGPGFNAALPPPPKNSPNPTPRGVKDASSHTDGFAGITHADQRLAGTGVYANTQFSLEPPDQGLCAGNGFVMEAVNNAVEVYDHAGHTLAGPAALSEFFGLTPEINRTTGFAGQFISDPKCVFDQETQHWILTELMEDNGSVGSGRTYTIIAVSTTADPTGNYWVGVIDTTDDGLNGTPNNPGCPCLGDQPLIAVNHYALFISNNEFGAGFNGTQLYVVPKSALIAAASGGAQNFPVVHIDAGGALVPYGGLSYSLQPANGMRGSEVEGGQGVEYFLSSLQFGNPGYEVLDNRIAVWALTGLQSLSSSHPNLGLQFRVIAAETYGQPNPAQQKAGPTPLGTLVGDPLEFVNTNDDRMNQVWYSDGNLYGAVNTIIGNGSTTGIAYFVVSPQLSRGVLSANVVRQGYVSVANETVLFPSIAVADGHAVVAFTLVGPDYYPSAAYTSLDNSGPVRIAANGQLPDDGFTGYEALVGPTPGGRWGDYSAAVVDGGSIWMATEFIPNVPRTFFANWGTFVYRVPADE